MSVCSGIEAASVVWGHLGWTPVAFAEIEPFPCAVLAHHYPSVPNLGDMTAIDGAAYRGQVDVLPVMRWLGRRIEKYGLGKGPDE